MSSSSEPACCAPTVAARRTRRAPRPAHRRLDPARRRRRARRRGHRGRARPRSPSAPAPPPAPQGYAVGWAEGRREAQAAEPRARRRAPRSARRRRAPRREAEHRAARRRARSRPPPSCASAVAELSATGSPSRPPTWPSRSPATLRRPRAARSPPTPAPTSYAGCSPCCPSRPAATVRLHPDRSPAAADRRRSPTAASPSSPTRPSRPATPSSRPTTTCVDLRIATAPRPAAGGAAMSTLDRRAPRERALRRRPSRCSSAGSPSCSACSCASPASPPPSATCSRCDGAARPVLAEVVASSRRRPDLPAARPRPPACAPATPSAHTGGPLRIRVGDALRGRVLDGLGRPLDGGPSLDAPAPGRRSSTPPPAR